MLQGSKQAAQLEQPANQLYLEGEATGLATTDQTDTKPVKEKLDRKTHTQVSKSFVMSKATPLSHSNEKSSAKQRSKILNASLNDMYVAENYYKGISDESILFERDGVISRLKQFDYKTHKVVRQRKAGKK